MTPRSQEKGWPFWLKLVIVLGVTAALVAPLFIWRDELLRVFADREQVAAEIRAAGAWGPAVIIGLSVAQTVVAPIPGQMTNFVAGYIYGPWLGLLYSWAGLILGAAVAMLLARYAGRPVIKHLVSASMLDRVDGFAAGKGLGFFFLFFLIPGLPDDLLCFVVGLTTLPLRIMLPMAAIARLPGLLGAVWLGASAEKISPVVWIVLAVAGLAILLLFWRYGDQLQDFLMHRLGGNEQHG
jgi:uncharacterized membrane protein YdjX (TVP38/TMEM64 family)